MKRHQSQPILRHFQESDWEDDDRENKGEGLRSVNNTAKKVTCMTIHKREHKQKEDFSWKRYGLWRQEQRTSAARLEKQLKARWAIEQLIDEQLGRFQAHYSKALIPTKMKDVSQLLMPKFIPAYELATLSWLGDWRPSAILELLRSLSCSFLDSAGAEQAISRLISEIRIEEAVIDEEMTEIQANCILHLPFGPNKWNGKGNGKGNVSALTSIQSEFEKVHRVITKAHNLRLKTLELVVKKVLSQTDAAEFLIAFAAIQDLIHQVAIKYKSHKGVTSVHIEEV